MKRICADINTNLNGIPALHDLLEIGVTSYELCEAYIDSQRDGDLKRFLAQWLYLEKHVASEEESKAFDRYFKEYCVRHVIFNMHEELEAVPERVAMIKLYRSLPEQEYVAKRMYALNTAFQRLLARKLTLKEGATLKELDRNSIHYLSIGSFWKYALNKEGIRTVGSLKNLIRYSYVSKDKDNLIDIVRTIFNVGWFDAEHLVDSIFRFDAIYGGKEV